MTNITRLRFDLDVLRDLVGKTVFERGASYHAGGLVTLLGVEPDRALAEVAGTQIYRTEVGVRDGAIAGKCSCPAFADRGACKHMVATALAANAVTGDEAGDDTLARIRRHLTARGIDALVEMIIDLAMGDPVLFRRLDTASAIEQGEDRTVESRLRNALEAATRTGAYIEYREASSWAAGVEDVLDAVADLVPGGRAGPALALATRALDLIADAIESVDDSDGHCGGLLERARDIHLAAARAARPDPVALARDLFERELHGDYGTFSGAAQIYADVLGQAGEAEYRRLASVAWAELPPRTPARGGERPFSGDYTGIAAILDLFAERDGDVEARIALRAKNLSTPWDYMQLVEFCRAQGREEEALRRAEEGLWVFEDESRVDERLVLLAVDLLVNAGRKDDAEARLWQLFGKQPNMALYERLRGLGGESARDRAVALLEARLGKERGKTWSWNFPADLLVRVLMREGLFEAAWAAVRAHKVSIGLRESLARASEAAYPRAALEVYSERVEQLAEGGGNGGYEEAVALIARMGRLRDRSEQAAYVVGVRARFGRRRNFMKLLDRDVTR